MKYFAFVSSCLLLDEDTEYAGIFKQYESQTQKRKLKPGNLFDALERVERQRGGNSACGLETVAFLLFYLFFVLRGNDEKLFHTTFTIHGNMMNTICA